MKLTSKKLAVDKDTISLYYDFIKTTANYTILVMVNLK